MLIHPRSNGGALKENDRVRVLPSGTLRIETAEPQDSANYSCQAHNLYGRDSVHYNVHVHCELQQICVLLLWSRSRQYSLRLLHRARLK